MLDVGVLDIVGAVLLFVVLGDDDCVVVVFVIGVVREVLVLVWWGCGVSGLFCTVVGGGMSSTKVSLGDS